MILHVFKFEGTLFAYTRNNQEKATIVVCELDKETFIDRLAEFLENNRIFPIQPNGLVWLCLENVTVDDLQEITDAMGTTDPFFPFEGEKIVDILRSWLGRDVLRVAFRKAANRVVLQSLRHPLPV